MPKRADLQERIERARRLAREVSDPADRERLEQLAEDYQRQLDEEQAAVKHPEPSETGQPSPTAKDEGDVAASTTETATDNEQPTSERTSSRPRQTKRRWLATAE